MSRALMKPDPPKPSMFLHLLKTACRDGRHGLQYTLTCMQLFICPSPRQFFTVVVPGIPERQRHTALWLPTVPTSAKRSFTFPSVFIQDSASANLHSRRHKKTDYVDYIYSKTALALYRQPIFSPVANTRYGGNLYETIAAER